VNILRKQSHGAPALSRSRRVVGGRRRGHRERPPGFEDDGSERAAGDDEKSKLGCSSVFPQIYIIVGKEDNRRRQVGEGGKRDKLTYGWNRSKLA